MTPPTHERHEPDESYRVERLGPGRRTTAKALFSMMSEVFGEEHDDLGGAYVDKLLARDETWILAAFLGDDVVGGLTAHELPLTRTAASEVFLYDLAIRADHQRRGVGRLLMSELRRLAEDAGIEELFVPADNDDLHALEFYRAVGGDPGSVTIFTFAASRSSGG